MGDMIELMFYSVKGALCGETLSYIPHYALVSSCRRTGVTDATKMGVATARLPGRWELKACDVTSTIAGLRRLASQLGRSVQLCHWILMRRTLAAPLALEAARGERVAS